jgi:transposase
VVQYAEGLSDRQAAGAVRARIDWKYALSLELTDPGFAASVLSEFRTRLVAGSAEQRLLDLILERFKARGLLKARGASAPIRPPSWRLSAPSIGSNASGRRSATP